MTDYYTKLKKVDSTTKLIFCFVDTIYRVMDDVQEEEKTTESERESSFSSEKFNSKKESIKIITSFFKKIKAETSTLILAFIYMDLLVNNNRIILENTGITK